MASVTAFTSASVASKAASTKASTKSYGFQAFNGFVGSSKSVQKLNMFAVEHDLSSTVANQVSKAGKARGAVVVMAKKSVGDLTEADLKGKRVFLRADLNVPLNAEFEITDDTRIRAAIPTIKYLTEKGAKVLLSSHLVSWCYNENIIEVHLLTLHFIRVAPRVLLRSSALLPLLEGSVNFLVSRCYPITSLF